MVESGSYRSGGGAEDVGDLRWLVPEIEAKGEDRALFRHEAAERSIELVAVRDAQELVRSGRAIDREHVQVRDPSPLPARLRDADIREHLVQPGIEPVRIAEARKVTPGDHQRVLQCILGPVDIPEDPVCQREQPIAAGPNQVDEGRLVASLRRLDEVAVHAHLPGVTPVGDVVRMYWSMVGRQR